MKHTRKCLLDVNHLPRARLHEPTLSISRPLQPPLRTNLPLHLQVAFVSRDDAHGQHSAPIKTGFAFSGDDCGEVVERGE